MEVPAPAASYQEEAETDKLADDGGPGSSRHPQVKDEDEEGI